MFILEILKINGINIYDPAVPDLVKLFLVFLALSLLCLLSFLNIIFYFIILFNKDNVKLNNLVDKHWILRKFFNTYINTTKLFLGIEIGIFIWFMGAIIIICFNIVNKYYHFF